MQYHDIIVIGASAGGIQALTQVSSKLPASLPAAVLIVLHQGPDSSTPALLSILQRATSMRCQISKNGANVKPGNIYIAPANRHMLVKEGKILLTDGPRENNYRPAIDTLFRSAAISYGARVIGVILTGMLQDGVAGMEAIKRCGGVCVVQHPGDAEFSSMPQSVIQNLTVDHILPISEMARLLEGFVYQPVPAQALIPKDLQIESEIAQRYLNMNSDEKLMDQLGERMPFSCPNCGGGLWKMKHGNLNRYRCHIGHSYTSESLFKENKESLEETLWVALRTLEDRKFMLATTVQHFEQMGNVNMTHETIKRREELEKHIHRLKLLIQSLNNSTGIIESLEGREDGEPAPDHK